MKTPEQPQRKMVSTVDSKAKQAIDHRTFAAAPGGLKKPGAKK